MGFLVRLCDCHIAAVYRIKREFRSFSKCRFNFASFLMIVSLFFTWTDISPFMTLTLLSPHTHTRCAWATIYLCVFAYICKSCVRLCMHQSVRVFVCSHACLNEGKHSQLTVFPVHTNSHSHTYTHPSTHTVQLRSLTKSPHKQSCMRTHVASLIHLILVSAGGSLLIVSRSLWHKGIYI